jgi:hypothetical protein
MVNSTPSFRKMQFSGHETFPLRQLWLRKAFVAVDDGTADYQKTVFLEEGAVRRFGVGKNMVAAIRHWALACDIISESKGETPEISLIGRLLFGARGVDPYMERPATSWLVHWLLAGRALRSTTFYFLFNRVNTQTFDRATLLADLAAFAHRDSARVSLDTLKRDIEVCLRSYVPRHDGREADDAAEPLLADLGLLSEGPIGTFQFRRGAQPTLPDGVFIFALLEFWRGFATNDEGGQKTMSFEAIAHHFGSPGRVFKLDESSVAERLLNLESVTRGALRWTDTAGVRQISRHNLTLDESAAFEFLRHAYGH